MANGNAYATSGPIPSDGCIWASFIYLHPEDDLTERTVRQIVMHNETREGVCGLPGE